MQKDFLDELMEELAKLHEEKKVSGLAPDIARGRTIEAFLRVAKNHKLSPAEKKAFVTAAAAIDGDITLSEAEMINAMDAVK